MDGLNLRWVGNTIDENFRFDTYGSLIPSNDNLHMEQVHKAIVSQNKADSGYYRRVSEINYRTDVEFTNNPYGNTPVIGAGYKMFGPRPMDKINFKGRLNFHPGTELNKRLESRQKRIMKNQEHIMDLHASLEPADKESKEYLVWLVEKDQMMTGGGFDGNAIGGVTESALNFVIKGSDDGKYADSSFSALVVEGAKWLRSYLESQGLQIGSLSPMGASAVRLAQESDGMVGWPVYAKALSSLSQDVALRLLVSTGVDTRKFVNSTIVDVRDGSMVKYRVVDALAYILDNSTIKASDVPSIVTILARIQKHGWKDEDGKLEPKKPKTRSIYPNSAEAGIIEAMTIAPFNDKLKELKVSFMPSLQDKPTRVEMVKTMIQEARLKGYDFLAADWSKYDATVLGAVLATVIYYAVRPFYNAKYYSWVDYVIYALVYKYLMLDTDLCEIHNDLYSEAKSVAPYVIEKGITLFGLTGGLISGAKFTHVGGSMYGEVVIHYVIPKLIGYTPLIGAQAGDDTLMAYPISLIDVSSAERTYDKIVKASEVVHLDINASKQMWVVVKDEPVKIFLQDDYHFTTDVWGIGSIFRPYDAIFFSERNKGLSIAEQLMAEIARMEQGSDNPFRSEVVRDWLDHEQVIGILFKEYGVSGFDKIVESIGIPVTELAQRIDVGSFTFGVSKEDLQKGSLHILPVIADVSAKMQFSSTAAQVLHDIGVNREQESNNIEEILDSEEDSE